MSSLYLITGPAGVGKSTVSKKIAEKLPKSVLIEGDDIYHQVVGGYVSPWKENNHLDIFFKVVIDMINNYLSSGYDVVFNYIIDYECLEKIRQKFNADQIKFTVLLVNEKTLLKRDKERAEECRMNERCIILLNQFLSYNYDKNNLLYTDDLTVEDTVNEIIYNDKFIIK